MKDMPTAMITPQAAFLSAFVVSSLMWPACGTNATPLNRSLLPHAALQHTCIRA